MSFSRNYQKFLRGQILLESPGIREAWHQGRRWYRVWVLQVEDLRVVQRRKSIENAVGTLIGDSPQSHVTVWVQGFSEHRSHAQEGKTVPLKIGGVNSFASCVFLECRADLKPLRECFGGQEERWGPYLPHLTVGRYLKATTPHQISRLLHPFRGLPPIHTEGIFRSACVDAFSKEGRLVYDTDPSEETP